MCVCCVALHLIIWQRSLRYEIIQFMAQSDSPDRGMEFGEKNGLTDQVKGLCEVNHKAADICTSPEHKSDMI